MGTWTVVNPILKSDRALHGSWGYSQNAVGQVAGWGNGGSGDILTSTEEYNGTSWSTANDVTIGRSTPRGGGTLTDGVLTSGLSAADSFEDRTELYDGISWSLGNPLLNDRRQSAGAGRAGNAVLVWSGNGGTAQTEEFDGTSWSLGGNFAAQAVDMDGSGTLSSAISVGGTGAGFTGNEAYEYDGAAWSALADLNLTGWNGMAAGDPIYALGVSGRTGQSRYGKTEQFNGTSWGSESDLNNARGWPNPTGGTADSGIIAAGTTSAAPWNGFSGSEVSSTEEWEDVPVCWNYTARYLGSSRQFKISGPGSFPKYLEIPSNVDKSTGKLIDDGQLIDPDEYEVL